MRASHSKKRTTAAVLRSIIGLTDSEMADLVNCSLSTIWSVESGRMKLSEALATRMAHETGVSLPWLLNGDPKAEPLNWSGGPFNRAVFEGMVSLKVLFPHVSEQELGREVIEYAARLRSILERANKDTLYHLAAYKIVKAIDAFAKEFGEDWEKSRRPEHFIPAIKTDLERWPRGFPSGPHLIGP